MAQSEIILLAYDIAHPKRLRKVALACEAYGARVQHSIFELHLKPGQLATLQIALLQIIDKQVDKIRYYRICSADFADIAIEGQGKKTQPHRYTIV
jgi:CRISPR-associated protein Cas2